MVSEVIDFYRGKSVFVTGGTGFLGSCLIEKLLRSCTDIKKIYVLIRPKKGKKIAERLQELIENSVFDRIRHENNTKLFNKLEAIAGDVGEENLGLSIEDRFTLVEEVEVIFHSAATLGFEGTLANAVQINLLGTRRILELGHEIRNLKALIHISSAYVNAVLLETKEQIYPAPADVDELLKCYNELSEEELEKIAPQFIKNHPNAYTLTKHLAEHEIAKGSLPSAIIRPSMITSAWKEPIPGWTSSKNGPTGFVMGASKGILRRLLTVNTIIYDYIPVDTVVNSIIVAGCSTGSNITKPLTVYHCTSSTCNPCRYITIENIMNRVLHQYPLQSAVWYPHLRLVSKMWLFRLSIFFFHIIPAYILDTVTRLSGGRPILVRLHRNVNSSVARLERFILSEWKFHNPRMLELHETLSDRDKETFNLDIRSLSWPAYFTDIIKGVRIYLCKEPMENLQKARSKDKILLVSHLGLQTMLMVFVWWIVKIILGSTWTKTAMIVPLFYFLFSLL